MGNLKIQGLKMNILSINNLRKIGREDDLFNSVTFGLNEGEKAALIGRNGSGKSTLLNTIAGVLKPDDGKIVINKESKLQDCIVVLEIKEMIFYKNYLLNILTKTK